MTKLAIIHTTSGTIEPLKALAKEILPGWEVVNFVDDSILPQLACNGGNVAQVAERLCAYARFAEQAGADIILEACSSVGELVPRMQRVVKIPVVRIDEAMAEAALRSGRRIGIAATLPTTLVPTTRLLQAKASQAGGDLTLQPILVEGAYQNLMAGNRELHDELILDALKILAQQVDVIVLAQASMARVVPKLNPQEQEKVFTSPRMGMEQVKDELHRR
jgi:Asp/Glu/hydantoin racemase